MAFHSRVRAKGFSLIEVVLTLAVTSILLLSLMSVMRIMGRAMPAGDDSTERALEVAGLLDRMRNDAMFASEVLDVEATSVTLSVPDRDGDSAPEQVEYSYDADAQTVTVSINGGSPIELASGVVNFALSARTSSQSMATAAAPSWGPTVVLTATETTNSTSNNCHQTELIGLSINPWLPSNATGWRITEVVCDMKRANTTPVVTASVRNLDASGNPTSTIVQSVTRTISGMSSSSASAQTFTFASPVQLATTARVAVIFSTSTTANGVEISAIEPTPAFHADFLKRSGSGSWERDVDRGLAMIVRGQYLLPTPGTTTITAIDAIDLRFRTDDGRQYVSTLRLAASPEAP
jgi:prepilin-type N-terminal cleavage/methylation domain-containing protein